MAFALRHLLAALGLAGLSILCGRALGARLAFAAVLEGESVQFALGLGGLCLSAFLLGLMGLLTPPILLVAALAWTLAGARRGLIVPRGEPRFSWLLSVAALLPGFCLGLYPPTAFDATLYHLPYARAFASAHRLVVTPDLRFPVFPQLSEALFASIFLFGEDTYTHAVSLLAMVGTALLLDALGAQLFSARAGHLAAAAFLGNPLSQYLAGTAYVDPLLGLFTTGGILVWLLGREREDRGLYAAAGALLGFAAGTKYLGLFYLATVLVLWIPRVRGRREVGSVIVLLGTAVVVALPAYLWIAWATGNPVFPFFSGVFGASEWSSGNPVVLVSSGTLSSIATRACARILGLAEHPFSILAWLWSAAFDPTAFSRQAPISGAYLLLAPLAFFGSFVSPKVRILFLFAIGCTLPWTSVDLRYVLPLLPALSLAGAAVLDRLVPGRSWVTWGLVLFLAAPGVSYGVLKVWKSGRVPILAEERDSYLRRHFEAYDAVMQLNRTKGRAYAVYGLDEENLHYFADGRFIGDWVGPYRFEKIRAVSGDPCALAARLRSMGADHFLVNRRVDAGLDALPAPFELLLERGAYVLYGLRGPCPP